ncbi:bifunctional folylpolyglutamate synthase/dihydrofolate synthase [Salinibacter altiplanensis]|uniref:bifunctional folylpolyglutamate synthase/dihydrofolate synthase n=1 Tax=Salinibacter altiplanensis TaxID=1803181 RepID=UPI000C9F02BE|nr:Mur ligase family protein [Salinibacter altiplanensis]
MPDDALDLLLNRPQYANVADDAYAPGLDRMRTLVDGMGNPHEALRAVHVAGTNGKGSTAAMTAAIATAAGLRTGLHTSPHLTHVAQRMRVDGTPAPTDWLAETLDAHRALIDEVQPSFFELAVALTFRYFAEQDVDLAVIEVGLGGRLDSTNVLRPALSVITHVGFDHTDMLGDTLDAIAREKAGIITPGTPALSAVTPDEARAAIAEVTATQDAPLHRLDDETSWTPHRSNLTGSTFSLNTPAHHYDRLSLSLAGPHQQRNAALAVRAAELTFLAGKGDTSADAAVREGLGDVRGHTGFHGRLDVLQEEPLIVVDVGHNPPAIAASLDTVAPVVADRGGTLHVCLNAVRGKQLDATARLLAAHEAVVIPIPIDTKRAIPPGEIAERLRAQGVATRDPRSLPDALDDFEQAAAPRDGLLLIGSHKLVDVLPPALRD